MGSVFLKSTLFFFFFPFLAQTRGKDLMETHPLEGKKPSRKLFRDWESGPGFVQRVNGLWVLCPLLPCSCQCILTSLFAFSSETVWDVCTWCSLPHLPHELEGLSQAVSPTLPDTVSGAGSFCPPGPYSVGGKADILR